MTKVVNRPGLFIKGRLLLVFALCGALALTVGLFGDEFQPGKAKVTASALNVRNIASAGGSVVGTLRRGDVVEVVARSTAEAEIDGVRAYWYKVTFASKDRKGKVSTSSGWIFGGYITFELNVERGLKFRSQRPSGSQNYRGVAVARNGNVLVGGRGGTIYITSNQGRSWRGIAPQALGNAIGVARKMVLSGNEIWVAAEGSKGGGVWKTANSGESWAQYTTGQGLPSNDVRDITRAADGSLWAATSKGVATSRDEGRTWKRFGPEDPIDALSIAVDGGTVIVGTASGLFTVGEKSSFFGGKSTVWKRRGEGQPNMGNRVYALALGSGGRIWAGTDKGLARSTTSALDSWAAVGGETQANSILMDGEKRILVCTDNGLNISLDSGDTWVTYKTESGLASNRVYEVAVDPKTARLWVTMGEGGVGSSD